MKCKVKLSAGAVAWDNVTGELSTEHAASCYGQPVLLIDGVVYGPGDRVRECVPWVSLAEVNEHFSPERLVPAWLVRQKDIDNKARLIDIWQQAVAQFAEENLRRRRDRV